MRFILSVLGIALISGIVALYLPWWSCTVVCFIVSIFLKQGGGKSFLMGFTGVGMLWFVSAMLHDTANAHILSARMAILFKLPNYQLFMVVTVIIGCLVGGLAAWSGALLRPKLNSGK